MSREKRGPSALEAWARQKTDGYDGVAIRNMTTSWRNGLAFCALIHRFRPDLIEYEKLDPCDILGNCALAFEVAERQLGIPALLDPEDMAAHEVPDRLSVLTYVAQFYNTFKTLEKKSAVTSRLSISADESSGVLKTRPNDNSNSTTPDKTIYKRTLDLEDEAMNEARKRVPSKSVMLNSANVCSNCKNPVFLSERVLFSKKLYHRSCFRCFNCDRILNPHTAEVSSDGLLFCLENACHVELRKRSRESGVNVSLRKSAISTTGVNSKENKKIETSQPPKSESVVPNENSVINSIGSKVKDKVSTPGESRKSSIQASFPPFDSNGDIPPPIPDGNPAVSNFTAKDRVAALRMKFLDDCKTEEDETWLSNSNSSSPTSSFRSRPISREDSNPLERSRSRSRSPGTISVGREPSDVLVVSSGSSFPCSIEIRTTAEENVDIEMVDVDCKDEDEGISSLEGNCGDSNSRIDVKLEQESPKTQDHQKYTPVVLSVAEQLAKNTKTTEKSKLVGSKDLPMKPEIKTKPDTTTKSPSSSPPLRLRFKEEFSEPESSETKEEPAEVSITSEEQSVELEKEEMGDSESKLKSPNLPDESENSKASVPEEPGDVQIDLPSSSVDVQPVQPDEGEDVCVRPIIPLVKAPENPSLVISEAETPKMLTPIKPEDSQQKSSPSPSPRKRGAPPRPPPARVSPPKESTSAKEVWKKKNYYPSDLNPFESEEQLIEPKVIPKNPFEDDEDEEEVQEVPKPSPTAKARSSRGTVNSTKDAAGLRSRSRSPTGKSPIQMSPSPKPRTKPPPDLRPPEPKPFNPFEDEDDEEDESGVSVRAGDETSSISSRLSDGSSFNSSLGGSGHPTPKPRDRDSILSNVHESNSMKLKSRKAKRAPLPPNFKQGASTPTADDATPIPKSPKSILKNSRASLTPTPVNAEVDPSRSGASSPSPKKLIQASPKLLKGLKNHSNLAASQQYKKKRRAPPPRRRVEPLPEAEIKTEMDDLSIQERELERQGIALESNIRRLMDEDSNNEQVDEMMVQLWNIVNEKNDILRRQTELEYLRRGHHLEEMQAELEFQLRVLMDTPMDQRQDDHTHLESSLLEDMLKLVDERNEVVDWLDFHRKQDREEASRVSESLTSFSENRKSNSLEPQIEAVALTKLPRVKSKKSKSKDKQDKDKQSKEKKNKDKDKEKEDKKIKFGTLFGRGKKSKSKNIDKYDEDKDLDESLTLSTKSK